MSSELVMGILIVVLGCVFSFAIRKRTELWITIALVAMWLEVQARAARDRWRAKQRSREP